MRTYDAAYLSALRGAQDQGIRPAWFLWVIARDRTSGADRPMGLWSGDEDVTLNVAKASGSGQESRTYLGGCDLWIDGVPLVADLSDTPLSARVSHIADPVQQLIRGYDARHAYCEVHATILTGGAIGAPPQLEWVGIIDAAPIETPAVGGDGALTLTIRSELMHQLTATNPAKSSDAHQKRRQAGDRFSEYSGVIGSRDIQWYKGKQ